MNTDTIESTIKSRLANTHKVGEKIYRGEKCRKDRAYAAFFVDYSEAVLGENFDLKAYQDSIIAPHYYLAGGQLQWDHYLLFVVPAGTAAKTKIAPERRLTIEKNTEYARKHIVNESELEAFLGKTFDSTLTSDADQAEEEDPYIRWIKRLAQSDLDGIFLESPYTEIVKNYIAGTPIKSPAGANSNMAPAELKTGKTLNLLRIETSERVRPRPGDFPLGMVTLLHGSNGAGKTSFLEAIELALCGATARNPRVQELESKVSVRFDGAVEFEKYEPNNNAKYRQRDREWYGNRYDRDNRLYESFGKYNFFDTDNAVRLATDGKRPAELKNAFVALALGEQINYLDERMLKVLTLLQREYNSFERTRNDLEKRIADLKASIQKFSTPDSNVEKQFEILKDAVAGSTLRNKSISAQLPSYPEFEDDLNSVQSGIELILKQAQWIPNASISDLFRARDLISNEIVTVQKLETKVDALRVRLNELEQAQSRTKALKSLLATAVTYLRVEDIAALENLSMKIVDSERRMASHLAAQKIGEVVDFEKIRSVDSPLEETIRRLQTEMHEIQTKRSEIKRDLKSLSSTLGAINNLKASIRALGKQYMDHKPDASDCPMCGVQYSSAELLARITAVGVANEENAAMQLLMNSERSLAQQSSDIDEKLIAFSRLREGLSYLFAPAEVATIRVDAGCRALIEAMAAVTGLSNDLNELQARHRKFAALGMSEDSLVSLRENLVQFEIVFSNETTFSTEGRIQEAEAQLASVQRDKDALAKELNEALHSVQQIAHRSGRTDLVGVELQSFLKNRAQIVESVLSKTDSLKKIANLDDNLPLETQKTEFSALEIALGRFKSIFKEKLNRSEVLEVQAKELSKLEVELTAVNDTSKRVSRGIHAIEGLQREDGKEKNLEKFLSKYRSRIVAIFRMIHAPREFDDLLIEGDEIRIRRESTQESMPLTMVSTGQRAALALSIFLTLHAAATHAPPILLIDDPVAHVDDLNTLAFLDYLREMVIHNGQQVLFATADSKLAKLLEKKFQFLGVEGFKKHILLPTPVAVSSEKIG